MALVSYKLVPELPKTETGLETSDRTSYFPGAGIFVFIVELINFNFLEHLVPNAPKLREVNVHVTCWMSKGTPIPLMVSLIRLEYDLDIRNSL